MSDTESFRIVQGSVYADGTVHGADEVVTLDPDAAEAMNAELEPADADEDDDPECADENCSRGVDEPGDRCWQHSDDEDDDEG